MPKIRILHVIKSLGRGGAEMLLPETLRLHNHEEFEFHYIYFLPWKDQMVSAIKENSGRVTCLSANNNLQLLWKVRSLSKYIRVNNIQIIHAHLPWAGVAARLAGWNTRVPVLYTEHNKLERYHFATRFLNLATMNLLTAIVAVSGDVVSSIKKYKKNLRIPVRLIVNGVNTEHFQRLKLPGTIRSELNIPAKAPLIGTIAVFRSQKRLDVWLEVASEILKQIPDAHFIIVGDGPLKTSLVLKSQAPELSQRVHFPGIQTEVRPFLFSFDVYMMSSMFEGLPIALLEAMSMECAVVSTDAGGIKEVVRDGEDGYLVSVTEPEGMVTHVITLIKDENLRKKLGVKARRRVLDSFSLQQMVQSLETLYREFSKKTML